MLVHAFERAVAVQEVGRGLRPDRRHARDVVGGVAGQREKIDDLIGPDAEFLLDTGGIEARIAHRIQQRHVVIDELGHILVGGRDHGSEPARGGLPRKGADHIVGLHAVDPQQWNAVGLDGLEQRLDLRPEVLGHRWAVRLVLLIEIVAKGS